jgi:hypothetical protein
VRSVLHWGAMGLPTLDLQRGAALLTLGSGRAELSDSFIKPRVVPVRSPPSDSRKMRAADIG